MFSFGRFCRRRKGLFLAMLQCLISSLLQRFIRHYLCCWALGMTIHMTRLHFKRKCDLLKLSFVCKISKFCNPIINMNISFFLVKKDCPELPNPQLQHCVYAKCCILLTVVAGLRTTNDLWGRGGWDVLFRSNIW